MVRWRDKRPLRPGANCGDEGWDPGQEGDVRAMMTTFRGS